MREQQFTKVLIDHLVLLVHQFDCHISQGQPLHPGTPVAILLHGHQGTSGFLNGMAQSLGKSVSVSGRTRKRIGAASGTQNHTPAVAKTLRCTHACDDAVPDQNLPYFFLSNFYLLLSQKFL